MKQFHAKLISRCMGVVVFLAVGAHDPRYSGGGSTATAAGGRSRGDREHPRPITQNHPHAPLLLDYVCWHKFCMKLLHIGLIAFAKKFTSEIKSDLPPPLLLRCGSHIPTCARHWRRSQAHTATLLAKQPTGWKQTSAKNLLQQFGQTQDVCKGFRLHKIR